MLTDSLLSTHWVPWRLRNSIERYLEEKLYFTHPSLYNRLRVGGKAVSPTRLTPGPAHHFFGYYDKSPWSKDQSFLLAHASDIGFRKPTEGDQIAIGVVDLERKEFKQIAKTNAWNYQQGAMLQWHPSERDQFVFNDRQNGRFISHLYDLRHGSIAQFGFPIYSLHPCGRFAYSLNFSRLATLRPDYGYAGVSDPFGGQEAPSEDGLYRVDFERDKRELILSLCDLAALNPRPTMRATFHWINHIQVSPKGTRLAFLHRWKHPVGGFESRLYTVAADGSDLRCALDTSTVSHYDWLNEDQLIAWAGSTSGQCYQIFDCSGRTQLTVASSLFSVDGHCSFSPDRRWVLTDTYPDRFRKQNLYIFDSVNPSNRVLLNRLWSCDRARKTIRCDLHPRWRPDGRQICIDSTHDGTRQLYLVDVPKKFCC